MRILSSIKARLKRVRKAKAKAFIYLSRVIIANEGGMDYYITGKIKHYFARSFSKDLPNNTHDNMDVLDALHSKRFSPIDLHIPAATIAAIQEKIGQLITDDDYSYVRGQAPSGEYYSRAIKHLMEKVPEVKSIISDELDSFLKAYYKSNYGVTSVLCWRNYYVPQEQGGKNLYSNDWHNDYLEPMELKLFINMTDVTEQDGPLHVIDSQTTSRMIKKKIYIGRYKRDKRGSSSQEIENSGALVKHLGKAGSAVLCHTSDCLHRAGIPSAGHYRDMLEFQFYPKASPLAADWEKRKLKYV